MRVLQNLICALLLAACSGEVPHATPTVPTTSPTVETPVAATIIPTGVVAKTATAVPTETVQPPAGCDPLVADFCILDGHFVFLRPIGQPGKISVEPTYRYGSTQNGAREPHHGVEFENASGTPVLAAGDGVVVFAGDDKDTRLAAWKYFYGNVVVIEHFLSDMDVSVFTLYGHLSRVDVWVGQKVRMGQVVGAVGASGVALGSHLHFEVRVGENDYGATRNPELWLIPEPGTGALAVRVQNGSGKPVTANINVQYFPHPDQPFTQKYQPESYALDEKIPVNGDDVLHENMALGGLTPGDYRISLIHNGVLYEHFVDVESGDLTFLIFVVR